MKMEDCNPFYLATNPMDNNVNSLIIHMADPKCIIEVFIENNIQNTNSINAHHKCFFHINSKGKPENWVFMLKDTCNVYEKSDEEWNLVLIEAWDWFNEYLHLKYKFDKENNRSMLN